MCVNISVYVLVFNIRFRFVCRELKMLVSTESASRPTKKTVCTDNCRVCSREICIKVIVMIVYCGLLLLRFIGLILFSIHSSDCLLRERHASYRCKNFTLFSHARELELSWQIASVFNTVIVILVLMKVPSYEGYVSALRNNAKFARFWSLFLQLLVTVAFNIIVVSSDPLSGISWSWVYFYGSFHSSGGIPVEWCPCAMEELKTWLFLRGSCCLRFVSSPFHFGKLLLVYFNFSTGSFPSNWHAQCSRIGGFASGDCCGAERSRSHI